VSVPALTTERLELLVVTGAVVDAVVSGDLTTLPAGLRAAPGWPTAGTLNGMRLSPRPESDDAADGGSRVVVARDIGEVIGDLGWKGGPDADGVAEIGYGLAAPSRGRGYGTEAVAAFSDWALGPGGATVLTAQVVPDNLASRRLLERVGFRLHRVEPAACWYRREG